MTNGFRVRRMARGMVPSLVQRRDRVVQVPTVPIMMRQLTIVLLDLVRVEGFQRPRRARMEFLSSGPRHRAIRHLVRQRMLKPVHDF